MFWIALAGPGSNVLLAFLATVGLVIWAYLTHGTDSFEAGMQMLQFFIMINLYLAVFNMIPLHPLDGGKVLARFLPREANNWLEDNQMALQMVLIGLFVTGLFRYLAIPVGLIQQSMLSAVLSVIS
jgi:Zn-dependent protease